MPRKLPAASPPTIAQWAALPADERRLLDWALTAPPVELALVTRLVQAPSSPALAALLARFTGRGQRMAALRIAQIEGELHG